MSLLTKIRSSLSIKLLLLFIISGIVFLILFQIIIGTFIRHYFEHNIRPHFRNYIHQIHREIGFPPNLERAKEISEKLHIDIIINSPNTHWSSNGKFIDEDKIRFQSFKNQANTNFQQSFGFYHQLFVSRIKHKNYTTLFLMPRPINNLFKGKILFIGLLSILGMLTLLYLSIRWLFQPIQTIQLGIQKIGSGELSHRISTSRKDELAELAQSINRMANEIEQMLEAKRQLLLAISHELRSPITRAKVALSLMDNSPQKDGLTQDLQEMEELTQELLEVERLKHKHHALNLSKISLNELIITVINTYYPREAIKTQLSQNLPLLHLDEARLRFVIKNLLGNAIKHQRPDSPPIIISSQQNKDKITLKIQDYGFGIAAEHLPHLTEPFYRADPSRQRKTGGYGLGLHLVKLIIEAHNGNLTIESELGKGTCVSITI